MVAAPPEPAPTHSLLLPAHAGHVTHVWRIEDIMQTDFFTRAQGQKMDGPRFSAFGFDWCLRIVPRTYCEALSVHACLLSPYAEIAVSLSVTIGKTTRHSEPATVSTFQIYDDQYGGYTCPPPLVGFEAFATHSELHARRDEYFPDEAMELTAVLYDCDLERRRQLMSTVSVPPPELSAAWGGLLESGDLFDVTLMCAGEEMKAHALVLSLRSPVFKTLLDAAGPWAAAGTPGAPRSVSVPPDIEPDTLRRLLHFLYTDQLTAGLSAEELQHLVHAADHYGVPRLLAHCLDALVGSLTAETVAFTLTLAHQHSAVNLRRVALAWIAPRAAEVTATAGWKHLVTSGVGNVLMQALVSTMAASKPPCDEEFAAFEANALGDGAAASQEAKKRRM